MKNPNAIKNYRKLPDRLLMCFVWLFVVLMTLVVAYPLYFIVVASISDPDAVAAGKVILWPVGFSLEGYQYIFEEGNLMQGLRNSIAYTLVGTVVCVSMTFLAGYPLSRKDLRIRGVVMFLFTVTMFFGGGMIPTYLVVSFLGLVDTFWAMIIPSAMGVWNVILVKTYIQSSIPIEIFESASLDGCSDWTYFTQMVLPLSKPIIAVMVLLYAVGKWNDFSTGLIYINTLEKQPFQYVLRQILLLDISPTTNLAELKRLEELKSLLQYCLIVVPSIPIICLYPFVQKHFVKGILMGSIKG